MKDTARIDCLVELSKQYMILELHGTQYFQPYRDTSLYYDSIAIAEAKKINYIHGIAESFIPKAAFHNDFMRQYAEAEKLARESLEWFERTGNKREIEVSFYQVGINLFNQYKYDEALTYLDQSYSWAEKHGNTHWMYNVLGFKYENFRDIGEYDKAFEAFQKSQELNEKFNGKRDSWLEAYVLAELQRRIGNYSTALKYYHRVIDTMDLQHANIWFRVSYPELYTLNGQFDSALYYYNMIDSSKLSRHDMRFYLISIGEYYLSQKDYVKALAVLLQGLNVHREANDIPQLNRALLDVAKTYTAMHHDKEALTYSRESLALSLHTHSKQYIRDACQILYDLYQRKNQLDSAFLYYQKYVVQKEIVENDVVKGKFAAYNYEQQIGLLNKEKQLQRQQLQHTSQQRTFLIIGIAGLLLLGIFLIRNILLKRKNEANRRIIAENELLLQKFENEKTKAELEQQATELEMQALRAQMNPHFIFNSLNSINRFILQNNKTQASEYLTKFSKLVRLILQNSQAAMIPLESELESLELYLDLESLRFDHRFGYKISVPKDLDADVLKVPPLIIQPFAENAIWHGLMHREDKGQLEIEISQVNDLLFFRIADNGIGRKAASELRSKSATRHKSVGLKITADRIALLHNSNENGSMVTINDLVHEDGTAAGTEVIIKIPVRYN